MLHAHKPIKTKDKIISVRGRVFYNDRRRRIDLKRPIRDLFENGSLDVFYTMELCLSKERALERVTHLTENDVMPVILYFSGGEK